jgi:gas vesicle protein
MIRGDVTTLFDLYAPNMCKECRKKKMREEIEASKRDVQEKQTRGERLRKEQ